MVIFTGYSITCRVSYRRGGALEFPHPRNLELIMLIIVLSHVLNNNLVPDCVRSNLRGFKFKIFRGGGGDIPPDPLSRYACLYMGEGAKARYYDPTMILLSSCSPPHKLKIMYKTLTRVPFCQRVAALLLLSNKEAAILLTSVLSKLCLNKFSVYVHIGFASSIIQVNCDNVQTVQSQQRWFRIWKMPKTIIDYKHFVL